MIAGDLLIFTCDGQKDPFVAALYKSNGKVAWKFKRDTGAKKKFSFATPLLIEAAGRKQLIAPGSGGVSSLDPETGREIWFRRIFDLAPLVIYRDGETLTRDRADQQTERQPEIRKQHEPKCDREEQQRPDQLLRAQYLAWII